jgi:hypothetical protein
MLCESHTHNPGRQEVNIENPRVVNGSQTLHSIQNVADPSATARVMVRIIGVPSLDPHDFSTPAEKRRDIINKISVRSNRQNPIRPWNLVSTDDFQHGLARFFRQKKLFYERRAREWSDRRTELRSQGIRRGPDIRWMAQLISSYHWKEKQLGPVAAKSLGELFDGRPYALIKASKPELAYHLYLLGIMLDGAVRELAKSKRYIEHFGWQAQFALLSLCVKAFQSTGITFGGADTEFLESADQNRKWLAFCKLGIDHIRVRYLEDARKFKQKRGEELTLANYFKSQAYASRVLDRPVPLQMRRAASQIARLK